MYTIRHDTGSKVECTLLLGVCDRNSITYSSAVGICVLECVNVQKGLEIESLAPDELKQNKKDGFCSINGIKLQVVFVCQRYAITFCGGEAEL